MIYVFALMVIFSSDWILWLKLLISVLFILFTLRLLLKPYPYPNYSMLSYEHGKWLLHVKQGSPLKYDRVRVIINTGLFLLVQLIGENRIKLLIIFADQITNDEYRYLKIKEKFM
ncbi:protein YgfX [Legionella lansingensis]|uniref:protein YgfX n=1 Tax=Legionella lansingensis TaxID=45067 RepID=UPI0038BA71FB